MIDVNKLTSNQKWALLFGIMAGDGCLSRTGRQYALSISGNINDDVPFYDRLVIPLMDDLRNKKTKFKFRPKHSKIEIGISDKRLFYELVDFKFPVGKKKDTNLQLPNELNDSCLLFIAGLFATDGSIWFRDKNYRTLYPCIGIKNKCKSLIYQVYSLMKELGFNVKIREVKYRDKTRKGEYELALYGHKNFEKFTNIIGLINPKHELKYLNYRKVLKGEP